MLFLLIFLYYAYTNSMYCKYYKKNLITKLTVLFLLLSLVVRFFWLNATPTLANMPFYALSPQNLVLRSKFFTSYTSSSSERKSNIKTASMSLDKTFIDVGAEFSFNKTVGARTIERGYRTSKIIVGGEFVDGVGGGVCQVSTTLYNAVLLAGLKITEYHPHSLAVSYVSPSFDAMVSYGFADLKFINNTNNPIILHTIATDCSITIEIYGEPNRCTYSRQSVFLEEILAPKELEIIDEKQEYPDLYLGQTKILKYSKAGLKSQGYLLTIKDGRIIEKKKIRTDTYQPIRGLIIKGTTPLPILNELEN